MSDTGTSSKPFTPHGFIWGPITVTRICSDPKRFGYVLDVRTPHGKVEIRVSPKGRKLNVWTSQPENVDHPPLDATTTERVD